MRALEGPTKILAAMLIGIILAGLTSPRVVGQLATAFFEGAGYAYTHVISLIVAASTFAEGINRSGLIAVIAQGLVGRPAAALAVSTQVSIMLAGFAFGLVIALVGEPRRLARQLFGITEGFFSPLFFVWLGASLQVRELGSHPKLILLGIGLGLGAVLAHCAGRLLGQPLTLAMLSAAQLGVPVAAATIGTQEHLLVVGEASALMFGALLTIACTSIAGALAARGQTATKADEPAVTDKST